MIDTILGVSTSLVCIEPERSQSLSSHQVARPDFMVTRAAPTDVLEHVHDSNRDSYIDFEISDEDLYEAEAIHPVKAEDELIHENVDLDDDADPPPPQTQCTLSSILKHIGQAIGLTSNDMILIALKRQIAANQWRAEGVTYDQVMARAKGTQYYSWSSE